MISNKWTFSILIGIKYNFYFRSPSIRTYSNTSISVVWIYSILTGGILAYTFNWHVNNTCALHTVLMRPVAIFLFSSQFMFPTFILVFFYGLMFCHIRHIRHRINHVRPVSTTTDQMARMINKEILIAKTLIIVISLFLFCWTPFCVLVFVWSVTNNDMGSKSGVYIITLMLGILNSSLNPVVYGCRSLEFRQTYIAVLHDFMRCGR